MDNLKHLISGYFYELWDQHEYASWEDAVDDFVRRSPERARAVPSEIEGLLAEDLNDEQLGTRLVQWGFDATPVGGERIWLSQVESRIEADLAARSA
ncbi:contact-dependent growth inhibition system immunity protein [Nocardioides sediminis]|uniref:contact-dependent growth inhibition system immunity protein n=1 Tax=Nocardioides sediminis TaxID=433648 RepID=UPI000D30F7F1|nr:contact-dependent growth inhibition system immunity protein [Nocardioides sediminis]